MNLIPEIKPGQSIDLLKELHILTRDGKLNQDSRRKLKQVYHLYQFIEPFLNEILSKNPDCSIVDHGAGKSYLGFIIYDLFLKDLSAGSILGIESRGELVQKSKSLAEKLKFTRMQFHHLTVEQAINSDLLPKEVDMVTALHACDTATDDAIDFGLKRKSKYMVLVPCCQAEVAGELRKNKSKMMSATSLSEIWRHPLHTREFGSHLTNVLRCLKLESQGYQVTVTELTGWEHSMKNELILAQFHGNNGRHQRNRLENILTELGLSNLQSRFLN